MTLTAGAWILALLVLGSGAAAAQTRPEFEVASIKPHIGGQISLLDANAGAGRPRVQPGGRFEGDRITVEQLLWFAYDGLREYQFLGLPDWGRTDRFVITATAPSNSSIDQVRLMVRSLLQDRFKMSAHMESRDMQLHALVFAHPDAALGPGVFRLDSCSGEAVRELMRKFPEKFMSTSTAGGGHGGCSSAGFSDLAVQLTAWLQVPFADATGLKGIYFYQFNAVMPRATSSGLGRPTGEPSDLPSLSTALEKELNLKIESRRSSVSVLVLDSIAQPTSN